MGRTVFYSILLAFIVSLSVSSVDRYISLTPSTVSEIAIKGKYEDILKRGSIRCGYYLSPPISEMNLNTKKLSGIGIALMEKIAQNANLKIDWVEEVQFGTMIAGLQSGRYDAICTPAWADAVRAREALFGTPLFYAAIGAWVRNDDQRFNENITALDNASVTVAVMDGDVTQTIANDLVPHARQLSFSGNALAGELLYSVVTHKADVAFEDINKVNQFLEKNPNALKNIATKNPVRVFPFSIVVGKNDWQLRALLDVSAQEIINSGYVDSLINAKEKYKGGYLRAAVSYK